MSRLRRRNGSGGGGSRGRGDPDDDDDIIGGGGGNASKKIRRSTNNVLDLAANPSRRQRQSNNNNDDEDVSIASHSDDSDNHNNDDDSRSHDSVEEEETLDAKKVRMAREYLRKLEAAEDDDDDDKSGSSSDDEDGSSSADDDDDDNSDAQQRRRHDKIGAKLQRERLKHQGSLERAVATKVQTSLDKIRSILNHQNAGSAAAAAVPASASPSASSWISCGYVSLLRGHDLTPTCVALQSNGERAITGSKDHSVILWDVQEQRKSYTLCNDWKTTTTHNQSSSASTDLSNPFGSRTRGEVRSVACSDDGRYAAVGRNDGTVCIYDIRISATTTTTTGSSSSNNLVQTFTGHKGPVTTLSFRSQSLELFSGSDDRCIRQYNLAEMMYLETLYGHQFGVTCIDCHRKERPVSVGRDRTARLWKIADDTHLIFRGGAKVSSADSVRILKDDWFLTGHDDGNLALWTADKKRAVATIPQSHGVDSSTVGRGVSAIGSLRGSDLAVTGSYDGYVRLWMAETGSTQRDRGLHPLDEIPINGHINGIAVGPKARFCVVAVGQEPKQGRFNRIAKAKNRFGIIKLRSEEENDDGEDDGGNGMDDNESGSDKNSSDDTSDSDDDVSDGE